MSHAELIVVFWAVSRHTATTLCLRASCW